MNKQEKLPWLVSIFFLVSGLLNLYALFYSKTTSVLIISAIILYSLLMFIIAVGLLKLAKWARYAALITVVINVIPFLKGSVQNIRVMYDHSLGLYAKIFTIFIAVTIAAIFFSLQAGIIWWLSKSSTKALFDTKSELIGKADIKYTYDPAKKRLK